MKVRQKTTPYKKASKPSDTVKGTVVNTGAKDLKAASKLSRSKLPPGHKRNQVRISTKGTGTPYK
jgi:hypothetical protein